MNRHNSKVPHFVKDNAALIIALLIVGATFIDALIHALGD